MLTLPSWQVSGHVDVVTSRSAQGAPSACASMPEKDPLTGKDHYLYESIADGPTKWKEAEAARVRLLNDVNEQRHPRTNATVQELLDKHLPLMDIAETTMFSSPPATAWRNWRLLQRHLEATPPQRTYRERYPAGDPRHLHRPLHDGASSIHAPPALRVTRHIENHKTKVEILFVNKRSRVFAYCANNFGCRVVNPAPLSVRK